MKPYPFLQTVLVCALGFLVAPVSGAEDAIDEIVVTADFRQREARDMPASITVLDGAQLDDLAVQHFEELVNAVPNFNWSGDGHRARYFQVRGVGELEQYQGAPNPSVGFLVDDIDFSGIGTIATLFDIERVEVLRGPQGTRYGANALAGLVYMRSAAPTRAFEGSAEVSVGSDDALAAGIALGGPLDAAGTVLGRLSLHHYRSDGFRRNTWLGRDDTNGRDETTARGRLHWAASEDWDIQIAGVYADLDDGYDAFALDNGFTMLSDRPGKDAQRSLGVSVRAEYSGWDKLLLTSLTSAATSDIGFSFDADWGNAESWDPVTYDYVSLNERKRRTASQEFRLSAGDWLLGVYAMRLGDDLETLNVGEYYDPFYDFADSLFDPLASRYDATNLAVFGQYDNALGERTVLSLGLRGERRTSDYADTAGLKTGPADSLWGGDLTLNHEYSAAVSSYVSLSRGYKAGGFNLGIVPDDLREFEAEALINLEAGIKSLLLEGRLRLNASVFVSRHDDQQVRTSVQLVPGDPASFVFLTVNAEEGRTAGVEADLRWLASDAWSFYASLGLLDTRFERFRDSPGLEGREQAHAPRYSLALGGSYRHPGGLFARVDVSARDDFYFDVSHDQRSEAYELVNARAGYEADDWTLQIWARNLFDEHYAVRGFYFGNEPPDFPNTLYVRPGDPRQVGITYEKRF
jgi:outer membrane receptor protein involved in Fe transport